MIGENDMSGYDPNEWTREFVVGNKDFCIRMLKNTNEQVINCIKQGEHKAAITGLDRILNGLVTMINAGYDYRSHVCFFSWIEANIMLFGNLADAPEENRLKTAKATLLDARDFAKSETAKNSISTIIDDINKGYSLALLANKYGGDFPDFETETLADLNNKLDAPVAAVNTSSTVGGGSKKKKPYWLIAVIIIIALVVAVRLFTKETEVKSPALADNTPTTEADTQISETELVTDDETETADTDDTDKNEDVLNKITGDWMYTKITEGTPTPDGGMSPAYLLEVYYSFDDNGRFGVGDAFYEEADEQSQSNAEKKDGRYWICTGGGGQQRSYTVNGNTITLVTDESIQYGASTTSHLTFTLDKDTLILKKNSETTVYKRTNGAANEY